MGLLLILNLFVVGMFICQKFGFKQKSAGFLVGVILGGTLFYLLDLVFAKFSFYNTANIYNIILLLLNAWLVYKKKIEFDFTWKSALPWCAFFLFALYTYNCDLNLKDGDIHAYAGWCDQLYHLSYIQTISKGANIPTTFPWFADVAVSYHFMFNYICGKVAQAGLNPIFTLNLMPALCMTALASLIVLLSQKIFKSKAVGIIAVLLMVFNGSLEFIDWVKRLGHFPSIIDIIKTHDSATVGNGRIFWIDMFLAQRHFAFSMGIIIFLFYIFYKFVTEEITWKSIILPTLILSVCVFWNPNIAIIGGLFLACVVIWQLIKRDFPKAIKLIVCGGISLLFVLPQIYMYQKAGTAFGDYPKLQKNIFADNLWKFWFVTLGVKSIFFIVALIFVDWKKRIFALISFLPFVIANLWQFGLYSYDNNKLLWGTYLIINIYATWGVVFLASKIGNKYIKWGSVGIVVLCMTLAGFCDYSSRVSNQGLASFSYTNSEPRKWIEENTPKDAVFLTGNSLPYGDNGATQISMAGRMIYAIYHCTFTSVDNSKRAKLIEDVYAGRTTDVGGVDYIMVDECVKDKYKDLDEEFLESNYEVVYRYDKLKLTIFKTNN